MTPDQIAELHEAKIKRDRGEREQIIACLTIVLRHCTDAEAIALMDFAMRTVPRLVHKES